MPSYYIKWDIFDTLKTELSGKGPPRTPAVSYLVKSKKILFSLDLLKDSGEKKNAFGGLLESPVKRKQNETSIKVKG